MDQNPGDIRRRSTTGDFSFEPSPKTEELGREEEALLLALGDPDPVLPRRSTTPAVSTRTTALQSSAQHDQPFDEYSWPVLHPPTPTFDPTWIGHGDEVDDLDPYPPSYPYPASGTVSPSQLLLKPEEPTFLDLTDITTASRSTTPSSRQNLQVPGGRGAGRGRRPHRMPGSSDSSGSHSSSRAPEESYSSSRASSIAYSSRASSTARRPPLLRPAPMIPYVAAGPSPAQGSPRASVQVGPTSVSPMTTLEDSCNVTVEVCPVLYMHKRQVSVNYDIRISERSQTSALPSYADQVLGLVRRFWAPSRLSGSPRQRIETSVSRYLKACEAFLHHKNGPDKMEELFVAYSQSQSSLAEEMSGIVDSIRAPWEHAIRCAQQELLSTPTEIVSADPTTFFLDCEFKPLGRNKWELLMPGTEIQGWVDEPLFAMKQQLQQKATSLERIIGTYG